MNQSENTFCKFLTIIPLLQETQPEEESSEKLMSRNNNDNSPLTRPHGPCSPSPSSSHTSSSTLPRSPAPPSTLPRPSPRCPSPYANAPTIATIEEVDSINGSNMSLR